MTAVRAAAAAAGGPASLSRFRGALVAAVLGDCVGGEFEGAEEVPMESVVQHLNGLDDETKGNGWWRMKAGCFGVCYSGEKNIILCILTKYKYT